MESAAVSVILPFSDHEHLVGRAVRRIAEHFRSSEIPVEIIAVDQGSGDNSQPVLQLLRSEIPELTMIMGRNFGAGVRRAKAPVLVLLTPEQAAAGLTASLTTALCQVAQRELDMKLIDENLLVCAQSCAKLIVRSLPIRNQVPRKLLQRGRAHGLNVRCYGPEAPRSRSGRISQVIAAMVPGASGLHRAR